MLRLAALFLAALAAFWPGQTTLPPSDRDEARFAQASRQMLETGDFGDIRFQDAPRHKKPIGIYWLQAGAAALTGGADAAISAYRAPSWVGAALAVPLTAWATAPLVGWSAATWAGALLGATALLAVEARIAKTDAVLLAFILLAMGALARVALDPSRRGMARLFWVATGLGALVKGPVVLLPALGAIGWTAAGERGFGRWRGLRPLEGRALALALAAPWLVAITIASDGAFWRESLWDDMLAKIASGRESHGAPPGLYLALFWATAWPMAALAPLAAARLWCERRSVAGRFLLGWIAPTWLVFELTATKLPHYVLPTYPAIAACAAAVLVAAAPPPAPGRWRRRAFLALWGLPALVLPLAAALAPPIVERAAVWPAVGLAAAAAVALALAGRALWRWGLRAFAGWSVAGAVVVYAAAFGFALPALQSGYVSPRLAAAAAAHRCAPGPVALAGFGEPSAVFALGTDTLITDGAGAAAALRERRAALAFVETRARPAFAAAWGEGAAPRAEVSGFNYSKGRAVTLSLFTPADAGCAH